MTTAINIEKSWHVMLIAKSNDCPGRYRKWNPPTEGWFCKETNKRCSLNQCLLKTDILSNNKYSAM